LLTRAPAWSSSIPASFRHVPAPYLLTSAQSGTLCRNRPHPNSHTSLLARRRLCVRRSTLPADLPAVASATCADNKIPESEYIKSACLERREASLRLRRSTTKDTHIRLSMRSITPPGKLLTHRNIRPGSFGLRRDRRAIYVDRSGGLRNCSVRSRRYCRANQESTRCEEDRG